MTCQPRHFLGRSIVGFAKNDISQDDLQPNSYTMMQKYFPFSYKHLNKSKYRSSVCTIVELNVKQVLSHFQTGWEHI